MSIFRAYDIRGIYNEEINESIVENIGKAYATYVNAENCFLGRDCRLSSPLLSDSFKKGVLATGCNVIEIGEVPTPVLYFAVNFNKELAGAMITASHNPNEYNGIKLCKGPRMIGGDELKEIEKISLGQNFRIGEGSVSEKDMTSDYIDYVSSKFEFEGLKIAVDCMNGVGGKTLIPILERLGNEVIKLNEEPNGNFPKHEPNPDDEENLLELEKAVLDNHADLGVALDGDADRAVFLDENGKLVTGTQALMIFIKNVLKKHRGKAIFDVMASELLKKTIDDNGGSPIISKTGHTNIRDMLLDYNGVFAGEASGHYFFKDEYFGFDDGTYATLRMAEIIAMHGKPSEMINKLPRWNPIKINMHCPEEKKLAIVEKLKVLHKDENPITIDGVRVSNSHGWYAIRPSNTESSMRAKGEFESKEKADEMTKRIKKELENLINR